MRKGFLIVPVLLGLLILPQPASAEVKYKIGGLERVRHEFWKNAFDQETTTKDNRNFFRLKTSLWGQADINENVSLYTRMTSEFKGYTYWLQSNGKKGPRGDVNEMIFDNVYVDLKKVFDSPVDLRIGRQDFLNMYGEGFLIQDGTPIDGSRTFYFNAIKGAWKVDEKNTVDFIYLNNPKEEEFFPVMNELRPAQSLNTADEEGYILYWKNKGIDKLALEPFYIYKTEGAHGARLESQKGRINSPGVYAKYDMDPYTFRGQAAFQAGSYGTNDRQAFGGYVFVDRVFKDMRWTPKLTAGYIYLSGDNPSTSKNEGWDSLWGRWPMWSELYLLTFNGESGMGYWTNLSVPRIMLEINPTKKVKLQATYNYLMANEFANQSPSATTFSVGDGKNRGHLPQLKAGYTLNSNVSAYILGEYFIPGNYYAGTADPSLFVRTELMIKF